MDGCSDTASVLIFVVTGYSPSYSLYMTPFQLNVTVKTQQIRLMDTFLLGPFMVYAASLIPEKHRMAKNILVVSGVMTAVYNYGNYIQVQKMMKRQ